MDKPVALDKVCRTIGLSREALPFLGDYLNDLVVQCEVALLLSTADGARHLREHAETVVLRPGVNGAVHELGERLIRARGLW